MLAMSSTTVGPAFTGHGRIPSTSRPDAPCLPVTAMAAGSPLRATVADAPAASTLERPAALFCGPGLVHVGRALQRRMHGPPRGVQNTSKTASAAGACRLGRYRGQRGSASLNPFTPCTAEHCSTKPQHAACQVAPGSGCNGLRPVQHAARVVAGGHFRWQCTPQSRNTHARAGLQTRTHVCAQAQTLAHLQKHYTHARTH